MKGGGAGNAKLALHNDLTGDQVTLAFRFPLHASVLFNHYCCFKNIMCCSIETPLICMFHVCLSRKEKEKKKLPRLSDARGEL